MADVSNEHDGARTLRGRTATGVAANVGGSLVRALFLFAGGLIFARTLGPGPMGEFALAASIAGLAQLVLEVGLGSALVQQERLSEDDVRFVFTVSTLLGLLGAVTTVLVALAVSGSAGIPGALAPAIVLAGGLLMHGVAHTAQSLIRRRLQFGRLQTANIIGYVLGLVAVGVPLAVVGRGAVAPAAALATQDVFVAVWALRAARHPMRPKFTVRREIARFSLGALGSNISNWGLTNIDTFAVAQAFNSAALGLYSRAYFLAFTPISTVMAAFQGALFAASSRATERRAAAETYLAALNIAAITLLAPLAALATVPNLVLRTLYGSEWAAGGPALRVLAIGMPFLVLGAPATAILWSRGHARLDAAVTAISVVLMAAVFVAMTPSSLVGVAATVGAAYALRFLGQTALCMRQLEVGLPSVARVVLPGVALSAGTWAAITTTLLVLPENVPGPWQLVAAAVASALLLGLTFRLGHRLLIHKEAQSFWSATRSGDGEQNQTFDGHGAKPLGLDVGSNS